MSTETLTGTTRRAVTFSEVVDGISHPRKVDAGATVYVTRVKDDGTCTVRVAGTLLEQRVHLADVEPC